MHGFLARLLIGRIAGPSIPEVGHRLHLPDRPASVVAVVVGVLPMMLRVTRRRLAVMLGAARAASGA